MNVILKRNEESNENNDDALGPSKHVLGIELKLI